MVRPDPDDDADDDGDEDTEEGHEPDGRLHTVGPAAQRITIETQPPSQARKRTLRHITPRISTTTEDAY
jgi:hypothetical protein